MNFATIRDHLIQAVAAASVLGGGSMVMGMKFDSVRQHERIERLEEISGDLKDIREDAAKTREDVAVIKAKLETQNNDGTR